jgi:membrane protease YdiL (CAAX protease family)
MKPTWIKPQHMQKILSDRKEVWKTILIFLIIVTVVSTPFHLAIVKLYPSSIYVGALMWCPAIAAIITLKIKGRSISSLNWNWGNWKYIRLSYFIPALYVFVTYSLIWVLGFGGFASGESIMRWAEEQGLVGIGTLSPTLAIIIGAILLASIGVIKAMSTVLGEEIGWRGFLIYEARKVLSYTGVALFVGFIWALWHWPILFYYSSNVVLEFITFFVFVISMSFIMTYFAFKSKSLWPGVIFHSVSNVYVQKIFPPLTSKIEGKEHWLGENGIMFAIVTFVFAIYFLRRAIKEKL